MALLSFSLDYQCISTVVKSLLNNLIQENGENIGVSNVWQQQESLDNSFTWIGHATIYLNLDELMFF